jgi:hypothetical protein
MTSMTSQRTKLWLSLVGHNCRDQSRSRLRFLNMSRCQFSNCREFQKCQDIIFITADNFSTVKTSFSKCQYRESRSRPHQEKWKPPKLSNGSFYWQNKDPSTSKKCSQKTKEDINFKSNVLLSHSYLLD